MLAIACCRCVSDLAAFLEFALSSELRLREINQAKTIADFLLVADACGFHLRFADVVKYQASKILQMSPQERDQVNSRWGWIEGRGQPLTSWSELMFQMLKSDLNQQSNFW